MDLFGVKILKSRDFSQISKRLENLETDSKLRPIQEAFSLMYQDGAVIPKYASDLQPKDMLELAKISAVYRQILVSLQWALFRRGAEFKPKFVRKCTNEECLKEFDTDLETCDNCGSTTREPIFKGVTEAKKFFERVNDNGDSLIDVCRQAEPDVDTLDDQYICIAKDYFFGKSGNIIASIPIEIFRINPSTIFMIADKRLRMGRNEDGKKVFFCPDHRNKLLIEKQKCPFCGKQTLPAYYKSGNETGEPIYYADQEIIHNSKFSPSLLYGFPPFISLYQKVMIELNMDWYVKKSYEKGRPPNSWVFVKTSNALSLQKMLESVMALLQKNPHASLPIGVPTDASGQFVQQVKMLDNMAEMQSIEYRNAIKSECGALFGVMPIFQGDLSTSGGLNNEGLQITVTNRAMEVGQGLYNEKVFPRILEAFGITDYKYELLPSEEKDEVAELQKQLLEKQNAQLMLSMGFDVALNEKKEFEFSGTASRQELPQFGSPAPEGETPSDQRFGGEPESAKKFLKAKAKQVKALESAAGETEKTLEETLKEFAEEMDWKRKPSETALKMAVRRLVQKFGVRLKKATKSELESIYKKTMDAVEKELQVNVVFGKPDKNALELLANSKALTQAYDGMTEGLSKKINDVIEKAYEEPELFTMDKITTAMKSVADEEEYKLRRIARTETSKVSNTARLNSYMKVDDGTFKFRWLGPADSRTTDTCKAIKERTKNGVSLKELKKILEEEAKKANPEFEVDGMSPHYSCRHVLVKVV